jgi:8-oxo-dGTP pyrophosphatase MutT (NUDIX family)
MGLGQRGARRHETSGAHKHAGVRSEDYWDFAPDQHVMTVDGVGGIVTAVLDGPYPGNETYEVTLDSGLGGGQYTASQLSASDRTTASVDHTAADDYPELGSILSERPDPALQRYASQGGGNPFGREARHHTAARAQEHQISHVYRGVHGPDAQGAAEAHRRGELGSGMYGKGVYVTSSPDMATSYAQAYNGDRSGVFMHGQVHPDAAVGHLDDVPKHVQHGTETDWARERGHDVLTDGSNTHIVVNPHAVTWDPKNYSTSEAYKKFNRWGEDYNGGPEDLLGHHTAARAWFMDDPKTDWNQYADESGHLDRTPIHRGMRVWLDDDASNHVHDESKPVAERAHALLGAMHQQRGNFGMHWTANSSHAEDVAEGGGWTGQQATPPPGYEDAEHTNVVLHAAPPHVDHIEQDQRTLDHHVVTPFEGGEEEVPLKHGAPVHITGISWQRHSFQPRREDRWAHHTFDEPMHHTALLNEEDDDAAGSGGDVVEPAGADDAEDPSGQAAPASCSYCGATEFTDLTDNGRSGQATCAVCGGTMSSAGGTGQWTPELIGDPSNHPKGNADPASGGVSGAAGATDPLIRDQSRMALREARALFRDAAVIPSETCGTCKGKGTVSWSDVDPDWQGDPDENPGKVHTGECDDCEGTGRTPETSDEEIAAARKEVEERRARSTAEHVRTKHPVGEMVTYHDVKGCGPNCPVGKEWDRVGHPFRRHASWDDDGGECEHCGYEKNDPDHGEMHHQWRTEQPWHTDWDEAENVGGEHNELHRGMALSLPDHVHDVVHDESRPLHERAKALSDHIISGNQGHLGRFWSDERGVSRSYATSTTVPVNESQNSRDRKTPVVIHAHMPAREHIETDPDELSYHGVYSYHDANNREVPLQHGTPLHLKGVSWHGHVPGHASWVSPHPNIFGENPDEGTDDHAWTRHDFDGKGIQATSSLQRIAAEDGPDWCTWRRMAQCTFPNDRANNLLALPQVRGACPWTTRWEQQVCPISEPGPMALMQRKGAVETHCQTPGAQFHTTISDSNVGLSVDMPRPLNLNEVEATLLESNMHNAMELVLRPYFDKTASKSLSWDEIGDLHPHVYGDSEIHGDAADGADGPGIGDAANYLAHERPGHQDAEDSSVHDMTFRKEMVHPRHIDYSPSGPSDHRVMRAREGYSRHPDEMPPLVLVKRHNVYQVADGHHRAEAAHGLDMPVKAYVAHSPHDDEPFADGHKGAFYNAEPIEPGEDKRGSWERHNADEHGELAGPELDDNPSYTRKRHDKIYPGCSFTGAMHHVAAAEDDERIRQSGLPLLHPDDTHEERTAKLAQHYEHLSEKLDRDSAYEDGDHPLSVHHQEHGVPSFNHATHSGVAPAIRANIAAHLSRNIAATNPAWPPTVDIERPGDSDLSDGIAGNERAIYHPYGNHIVVNHDVAHDPQEGGDKGEGWYSHTGDASPLGHVLTHEYGHFLEHEAFKGADGGKRRNEMLRDVSHHIPGSGPFTDDDSEGWLNQNREHVERHVGGYAAKHPHELIAELYAENHHSPDPSEAAQIVGQHLGVPTKHVTGSLRRLSEEDYRMQHQAPDAEGGAPAHDLTGNGTFPADVYTHPHYYDTYHPDYNSVHSTLRAAQGNPEKKIRIYRALPAEHAGKGFNTGDWVSTSKEYARDHGRHHEDPKHDWPVISTSVPAKHIHTEGDLMEWGYNGPPKGGSVAFKGGHHQEVSQRADGSVKPVQRKPKSPERQTADKLKDAGYSFSHYGGSEGHTVAAYGPDENWAGLIKAHPDGTVHHVEIDPEHAHMPLEEHMRSMIPGATKKEASVTPDETREMVRLARKDSEFGFHVIATWADVRNKAKRIRREGGVTIKVATNQGLAGDVQGDHGRYETMITYRPGTQKIADWKCGCKWGDWAFQRVRFYGRQCSHSLALQYEAQSRGMFGRDVHLGMRDVVGTRPIEVLASSLVEVEDPGDVMKILMAFGLQHSGARQVLDTALGRTAAWPDDEDDDDDDEEELPDHQRDEHGDCVFYPGHEHEHYDDEDQGSKQCPYQDGHTDWNRVHPHLGSEIHRGMSIDLHRAGVHDLVHNDSVPMSERAHAISQHLSEDHLGTHWTDKQDTAKHYTHVNGDGPNGHHTKVVLHAEKPERHEIEEDPEELANGDVIGYGNHDDREVPLQHGGDVRVKGISWHSGDQWHRHDFGQPRQHIAAKTHMCPHCGHEVAEDARTCPECGNRLTEDVPELHEASRVAAEHEPVYLRFGDWSDDERSHNNVTGFKEDGVSVYDLDHHGNPKDPDPDFNRGHEHDEHCEPDCDLDSWNDDYGNDTREEMEGRVRRAERNRANGYHRPGEEPHLVKGDMVSIGHDGEPLLNNVRRVGDWIDHRHHFIPGAEPHRLARHPDDEDYEPPEEHPGGHTAKRKKKRRSEDTRKHAPQFGYGVPGWGLPILWCPQCTGGGCGHCGGTGQVTQAPASSPSTTADPVPDQNSDAGEMTTGGISAVSAREASWLAAVEAAATPGVSGEQFARGVMEEFHRLQAATKQKEGPTCSGVALKAADTGRVLMLQRGLDDPDDPAAGTWEFPGGHHEDGDVTSLHAGIREWQEEVGQPFPEGGVVHHTWTSPSGVYQGHVVVIPSEKDLAMHEGRVIPNPDDPKGDHHEQAAWWDIDHAKGNKVLRDEVRSGTPWKEIAKAGEAKTAAAWDSLSSIDPQPGRGTSAPGHSVSQNPASTGPFTAQDPASWDELNTRESLAPDMSYDSTLHAQPEPALPSTDGAAEDDEHGLGWLRPGTHQYEVPDTNSEISDIDQSVTPNSYHGAVARAAEAAVEEPSGVSAIVARFQASAAAQGIMAGSAQPAEGGDDVSFDFTAAAREHLAKRSMTKTALKDFDFAEQQALINEGKREGTRARNFGDLQIEGTHYKHLEAALGLDEADSEDLFA